MNKIKSLSLNQGIEAGSGEISGRFESRNKFA